MGVHHPGWGSAPLFLSPEERFFAGVVRTVSLTWRTRTLQPVSLLPTQDSALLAPAVVFTLQSVLGRQTPALSLGPICLLPRAWGNSLQGAEWGRGWETAAAGIRRKATQPRKFSHGTHP